MPKEMDHNDIDLVIE